MVTVVRKPKRADAARWRENNRERLRANAKRWYKKNRKHRLAQNREWRQANREQCAATSKKYQENNKDTVQKSQARSYRANRKKRIAYAQAWKKANPERVKESRRISYTPPKARAAYIRQTYGLSMPDYEKMYAAQKGICRICKINVEQLHIDHDHNTGKVRGLLCRRCNQGIGFFKDDTVRLDRASRYLKSFNK